jgi:hypothetical protein
MKVRAFDDGSAQFLPEKGDPEYRDGEIRAGDFPAHPKGGRIFRSMPKARPWLKSRLTKKKEK